MRALFIVTMCVVAAFAAQERFDGHQVLRLQLDEEDPVAKETVAALHAAPFNTIVDFWEDLDIRVAPEHMNTVLSFLKTRSVPFYVMIDDVQKLIDQETTQIARVKSFEAGLTARDLATAPNATAAPAFFNTYRKIEEINAFVDELIAQYPTLASKMTLGTTYENRTIYGLVIKSAKSPRTGIYFEGGIHAREWVAHATVTYLGWSLLSGYGNDPETTRLVDSFTWHIVPSLNVDGYVFTHTSNRMWRKTRTPNQGSSCIGTDPNRNWGSHWCTAGADRNPCSDAYCGPREFSEREVKAAADYICANNMKAVIDFHSYSQLWLTPYGYSNTKPKDFNDQQGAALAAVAAIKATHGLTYKAGPIYSTIYPASGSSADYAYDFCGTTYSYGVELRDTGRYGFLLPPEQIVPTGEEIWAAIKAMGNYMLTH